MQHNMMSILSADSLVNLASWIMKYGTKTQQDFVRGQIVSRSSSTQ